MQIEEVMLADNVTDTATAKPTGWIERVNALSQKLEDGCKVMESIIGLAPEDIKRNHTEQESSAALDEALEHAEKMARRLVNHCRGLERKF